MSIAVIQMVSQDDVTANLAAARRLLEQAAEGGARLAVLPENFAAMGRRDLAELGAPRRGERAYPAVVEFRRSRPQVVDSRRNAAAAAGGATRGEGECLFAAD